MSSTFVKNQRDRENKIIDTLSQEIYDFKKFIINPNVLRNMVREGFSTVEDILVTSDEKLKGFGLFERQIGKFRS